MSAQMPSDPARSADYERALTEWKYWSETATMWADEATRRARFIHVADVLAQAIRSHGSFMDDECRDALALYDEEWAELHAAHNDGRDDAPT